MAAMSSHTLKHPRTTGVALVVATAIGAASLIAVAPTRADDDGPGASVPDARPAPVTASLPVTVAGTQGPEARVTTFSDPDGRLRAPRALTVAPDGNIWFTAYHNQLGRMTPGGEISLYSDPAGRIDTPDSICTGAEGGMGVQ